MTIENIKKVEDLKEVWCKRINVICTDGDVVSGFFGGFERPLDDPEGRGSITIQTKDNEHIYIYFDQILKVETIE